MRLTDVLAYLTSGSGRTSVAAQTFWEDSLRYLYLPRLKTREVLASAIRSGAASRDFFGTAYGQDGGKYDGFRFGDGDVSVDDTLLLIEPEAAKAYSAGQKKAVVVDPPGDGRATILARTEEGSSEGRVAGNPIRHPRRRRRHFWARWSSRQRRRG